MSVERYNVWRGELQTGPEQTAGSGFHRVVLARDYDALAADNERLRAIVDVVRVARREGWYDDNPGWEPVDAALATGEKHDE